MTYRDIKIAFFKWLHRRYPQLHKWEWMGLQDCTCCGFEGFVCWTCESEMIIGWHAEAYKYDILAGTEAEDGY